MQVKTIGVLTSGGDAPGMNAAVRAVVRTAIHNGIRVMGIRRGYTGLIKGDMYEMNLRSVSGIIQRGGTILYTARCPEFRTEEGINRGVEVCKNVGIDGMVIIGGDGSFRGAADLSAKGIPCVGIPGTIDNDISCSDYTIGFDTAVNTATELLDKIRDTAESHDRCSIVEVMGRRCGDIALHAGIAAGATAVIIPEVETDIDKDVIERIIETKKTGKEHFIIVVAEGCENAENIHHYIEEKTGITSKKTVLGHVQRGGSPTVRDRVVASQMGYYAVELLKQGIGNRVIAIKDGKVVDFDIKEALSMKRVFDQDMYKMLKTVSI